MVKDNNIKTAKEIAKIKTKMDNFKEEARIHNITLWTI